MQLLPILFIFGLCNAILATDSCVFRHPTQGVIDLTSLGSRNGQARFRDVSPLSPPNNVYSFNPCFAFVEGACQNAAVCQLTKDRAYARTIATQNASYWTLDAYMTPTLTYTSASKIVSITMICSNTAEDIFEVLADNGSAYIEMRLRSRCACWNQCMNPPPYTTTVTPRTSPTTTARSIFYNECMYHDSRYGTIDLSSVGSVTGRPAFKDIQSFFSSNHVWSYNPCYSFSEDQCQHVAGCQIDKTRGVSYAIGLQNATNWINMNSTDNLNPTIRYASPSTNRRLSVQLICDRSSSFHRLEVLGETSVGEYLMQLTSPCACWNGCSKRPPHPSPIDWNFWSILGIVGGVVFFLFLIMITCLFCSTPKRRYQYLVVSEKTPFLN